MAKTSWRSRAAWASAMRVAPHLHRDRLVRVQGLHEVAAELGLILIDDGDREAAKNLRRDRAADRALHRRAAQARSGPRPPRSARMRWTSLPIAIATPRPYRRRIDRRLLAFRRRIGDGAQPRPGEREIEAGEAGEDHEGPDGIRRRQRRAPPGRTGLADTSEAAGSSPRLAGEAAHRHDRESHAGEAERRIAEDARSG